MSKVSKIMMTTRNRSESGFSLMEVLIAITILTVGMLGAGVLSLGVLSANETSKDKTVATTLAQDAMEAARTAGYSGLPAANSTVTEDYGTIVNTVNGNSADYSDYKRVTTVEIDTPAPDMKTVTISVFRRTGQSPVVFTTIMSS